MSHQKICVFTIGFAQKNAKEFFATLKAAGVKHLIDIRLNNISQLAGFTKKDDLQFFLREICGISYSHKKEFAPTEDILDGYKKKIISWKEYESKYNQLIENRQIAETVDPSTLDMTCLLCSEPKADQCHRRLLAEYFHNHFPAIQVIHL